MLPVKAIKTHVFTAPVLDLAAFKRTAFWLSRTRLPAGSFCWTVAVDPSRANPAGVLAVLRSYKASYHWRLVVLEPCEDDADGTAVEIAESLRPYGADVSVILASDAIVMPEVLPALTQQARDNPDLLVACKATRLPPDIVMAFDDYGSTLVSRTFPDRTFVAGRFEEQPLAAWSGDVVDQANFDREVFVQLDRSLDPFDHRKHYVIAGHHSSGELA